MFLSSSSVENRVLGSARDRRNFLEPLQMRRLYAGEMVAYSRDKNENVFRFD